jgi:hypothetical protein
VEPILALIVPFPAGTVPTPPQPPTIWPSPGVPTHPIYYPPGTGQPPPTIWPSPGHPTHPIYYPPSIWPSPGVPTHPIAPGGPPPEVWPGPGIPTHPIVIPPGGSPPPGHPAFPIWGGPGIEFPDVPGYPPVAGQPLPPEAPAGSREVTLVWVYRPGVGWVWGFVPVSGAVPKSAAKAPDKK